MIQCTSDQAAALISHVETYLAVHHSPDLFHVQQEACRATSVSLNRQTEKAENAFKVAKAAQQENARKLEHFEENWPCSLKQLESEKELKSQSPALEVTVSQARQEFESTQARQHRAREARLGIGQEYHPFDLKTGVAKEAAKVQSGLNVHFDTLDQIASEAQLKPSSVARLAKAKRVLPSMIETILFFWSLIANRAAALHVLYSPEIVELWRNRLVAGYYLASVAKRCSDSKERKRLMELSKSFLIILDQAKARDGPLSALSEQEVSYLEEQARMASELFQRSSSCVEGRNGQLSLRHHGLREITPRKLRVLGVLHNFVIKRSDGTTAAHRSSGRIRKSSFLGFLSTCPFHLVRVGRLKARKH